MVHIPDIDEWLVNKNILITGATGYIGKCLLYKLMRSCPDIGTIYILLRSKKEKTVQERFDQLKANEIFTFHTKECDWNKVKAIAMDTNTRGLGIPQDIVEELKNNVNIIYHSAASVKFQEPLHSAIKSNLWLTREILQLAKSMKNLQLFAHVSTAYCNIDKEVSKEEVYPSKMDWRRVIEMAETMDEDQIQPFQTKILNELPLSYLFTKQLAETAVWEHRHLFPVLIFRPVMVTVTKSDPVIGWSDNISVGESLLYITGKGIIRTGFVNEYMYYKICPGDVTINTLIAASWKICCHSKISGEPADNVLCTKYASLHPKPMVDMGRRVMECNPLPRILWKPAFVPISSFSLFYIAHMVLNVLPSVFFELLAKAAGEKNVPLLKIQRKLFYMVGDFATIIYTKHNEIIAENVHKLEASLSQRDKLNYDLSVVEDLEKHIVIAMSRFLALVGEKDLSIEEKLKHLKRLTYLDGCCKALALGAVLWYFPYETLWNFTCQVLNFIPGIIT